jgi:hypothetical protein
MVDGFNLHRLGNGSLKHTFSIGKPTKAIPKQVAFSDGSEVIVAGSDHSAAYVFDRRTGSTLQILRHGGQDMVQTITVCKFSNQRIIVTSLLQAHDTKISSMVVTAISSVESKKAYIYLWERRRGPAGNSKNMKRAIPTVPLTFFLVILLAITLFLVQCFGHEVCLFQAFGIYLSWSSQLHRLDGLARPSLPAIESWSLEWGLERLGLPDYNKRVKALSLNKLDGDERVVVRSDGKGLIRV